MANGDTRVFVYGTLKRGGCYHHVLGESRFVTRATTAPRYTLVHLGDYPALLDRGDTPVAGEIYEVSATVLDAVDALEGHPTYYRRAPIELADGTSIASYVFVDETTDAPVIDSGRWEHP